MTGTRKTTTKRKTTKKKPVRHIGKVVVHLFISSLFAIGLFWAAFFWSLGQTIDFMYGANPDRTFAVIVGSLIQFAPQVMLFMASIASGSEQKWWRLGFWGISALDAGTNIGAYTEVVLTHETWDAYRVIGAIVMYICCLLIVFAEELIADTISVILHDIAIIGQHWDLDPPQWLFLIGNNASTVGLRSARGNVAG